MYYETLRKIVLNDVSNQNIKIISLNILKKDDKHYVQLKLQNTSKYIITKFDLVFEDSNGRHIYTTDSLEIKPNVIFFDDLLIEIPDSNFLIKGFEKISAKKYDSELIMEKSGKYTAKQKTVMNILLISAFLGMILQIGILYAFEIIDLDFAYDELFLTLLIMLIVAIINPLFLGCMFARGIYKNKANYNNATIEEKMNWKKDLTPSFMWMYAFYGAALVFLTGIIIDGINIESIILSFVCMLSGTGFLVFYLVKRKKYVKDNVLIKRKFTIITVVAVILLAYAQFVNIFNATFNTTPNKATYNGIEYTCYNGDYFYSLTSAKENNDQIVEIPPYIHKGYTYYGVDTISTKAFENNISLKYVLARSICEIDSGAFLNCVNLEGIVLSSNCDIKVNINSFVNCPKLKIYVTEGWDEYEDNYRELECYFRVYYHNEWHFEGRRPVVN